MNAYKINGGYQVHLVIADNIAEAERIYNGKYGPTTIISIELISKYVQIQGFDEQEKRKDEI